jgi:hypothetical protein
MVHDMSPDLPLLDGQSARNSQKQGSDLDRTCKTVGYQHNTMHNRPGRLNGYPLYPLPVFSRDDDYWSGACLIVDAQ